MNQDHTVKVLDIGWVAARERLDGYDYTNQAWIKNGMYVSCGHAESMDCDCYGRLNAGQPVPSIS